MRHGTRFQRCQVFYDYWCFPSFHLGKMKMLLLSVLLAFLCRSSAASDVDDAGGGMDTLADDTLADDSVCVDHHVVPPAEVADIRVLNFNLKFRRKRFVVRADCEALHDDVVRNEANVANIRWHVLGWACDVVDIPTHATDVSLLEKIKCQ